MRFSKMLLACLAFGLLFSSCKLTSYSGYVGQSVETKVTLNQANFKVLGSFSGTATASKMVMGIKDKTGLVSEAKANMLENAKKQGVVMNGAHALINVNTDVVQNLKRITVTYTAEIIEFTK